jgi:hypothetical protein
MESPVDFSVSFKHWWTVCFLIVHLLDIVGWEDEGKLISSMVFVCKAC